jgi:hypothetical protein
MKGKEASESASHDFLKVKGKFQNNLSHDHFFPIVINSPCIIILSFHFITVINLTGQAGTKKRKI